MERTDLESTRQSFPSPGVRNEEQNQDASRGCPALPRRELSLWAPGLTGGLGPQLPRVHSEGQTHALHLLLQLKADSRMDPSSPT